MRLWRRAAGALKDHHSLWLASLSRRTPLRNPDIEAAVIKSTNHDDSSFDARSIQRVCKWIYLSPFNVKPLVWSVANRMEKTRNWVVAIKGLYLMHNVINCMVPCVKEIGRLPFDLSNFRDGHSRQVRSWPLNAFVRAYYAFLDQKSTMIFQNGEEKGRRMTITQELILLQKLQGLIDLLMQIKPQSTAAHVPLVMEAMDGIVIEIFDIYSRICRGIAIVLMNICSGGKAEAIMALKVVQKATLQGEELSFYFEFCREIGVVNASEFPFVDRVPEEGIQELERIIDGFSKRNSVDEWVSKQEDDKAIVVVSNGDEKVNDCEGNGFRTIITDKWEKFEEETMQNNPFLSPLITTHVRGNKYQELPDLISF